MFIGFCGGTGAGKTTLVNHAAEILGSENTLVLSQDHYYRHLPELSFEARCALNFDHPDALDYDLFMRHLLNLKNQQSIRRPVYSFSTHLRTEETVWCHPKKYILVEGILIFSHAPLRNLMNHRVFIDSAKNKRVARRINRDVTTRGRSVEEVNERFEHSIHKMHEQYVAPNQQKSDIVIENNHQLSAAKQQLEHWIKKTIY